MRVALSALLLAAEQNARPVAEEGGKKMSRALQELIVGSFCDPPASPRSRRNSVASSTPAHSPREEELVSDQAGRIARWVAERRGLVRSQEEAMREAMRRPVAILQGPPGTGKTLTASCLAEGLVLEKQLEGTDSAKLLLACAHSNTATDNLMEKLVELKLRTVRGGGGAGGQKGEAKDEE
eukprot:637855-Hanusia_phi.AAC.1